MSSTKTRFSLDHVGEEDLAEPVIPKAQLVTRTAPAEQGREVPLTPAEPNKAQLLAEQRFKPVAEKRATSVRFEPWIDDALNRRVLQLKLDGYRKITREAVITDAVMQYLGIHPPVE